MSRVRADARSPLAMGSVPPAAVTSALLLLLAVASWVSPVAVALVVLAAQLLVAGVSSPPGRGRAVVRAPRLVPLALGGAVAAVATLEPWVLTGATGTRAGDSGLVANGSLAGIGLGLAVVLVVALVGQLRRPYPRPDVVVALGDVVATGAVAILATGWVAVAVSHAPARLTLGTLAVAGLAALVGNRERGGLAMLWTLTVAALVGVGVAASDGRNAYVGAVGFLAAVGAVGFLAVGGAAALGCAVARRWRPLPPARWSLAVVAPLALAAPVAFVVVQVWTVA